MSVLHRKISSLLEKTKQTAKNLHFGCFDENSHFRTPGETPASATYHFPPSAAYSWLSISYSHLAT